MNNNNIILCKIAQDDFGMWKVTAEREDKKIVVAIKKTDQDAKELAFALHAVGKVDAVEINGRVIAF